jgi:hypothetical protein
MLFNHLNQPVYLSSVKTTATLKSDRVKPEFSYSIIPLDMNMLRFLSITRVEEKAIGTHAQNCWGHLIKECEPGRVSY